MRDTQHVALDASAGDRVSWAARRRRQRRFRAWRRHVQVSISCAVAAAELHSANKEDRRVVRDVAVQVGAPRCVNFDSESSKTRTPSFRRVVGAHELFCEGDENVDDPMPPTVIPIVFSLERCLKRLSERVEELDVEEVDHEEKRASQGCRGSWGDEEILEDNRCSPQGVPGLLGSEEEVPAFLGLPDVEEESHEDKHGPQACLGSSGAMEMLEGSRSAPLAVDH